ncbi:hypothetical protein B0H11DRAFT_2185706 [Mycena galericulata]|nr:hypothetical protein B0H11DRAFT_2185706 [Mycena galericulata]
MSTAPSQDLLDYLTHERRWRDLAARKVDEKLPSQLFEGRGSLNHDFTDLATDQEAAGSRLFQRIEVWSVKLSGSGAVLERYPAVVDPTGPTGSGQWMFSGLRDLSDPRATRFSVKR